MAERLGLEPEFMPGDWRHGADPAAIEAQLRDGPGHAHQGRCVVHNETSTGVTTPHRRGPRSAIDRAGHPALLLVDTISSLGSIDYRHDEWGVDVTVGGSQKGLMLPPGLSLQRGQRQGARQPRSRRSCRAPTGTGRTMIAANQNGFFPYTPATNLLYGLREAIDMLLEEGLRQRLRPPRPPRRGDAPRRARLGPRDPVRRPGANTPAR